MFFTDDIRDICFFNNKMTGDMILARIHSAKYSSALS